jgi:hypothetical protein
MTRRPYIGRIRRFNWLNQHTGNYVPGIGLWHGQRLMAHLTPLEAKQLADRLVDLAELIEEQEQT